MRILTSLVLVGALATSAQAQSIIAPTEHLAFDQPESWALKYFTSATALMGFDPAPGERPGSVAIQFEAGWLPALSPAQEQVGFAGTAAEDLNKAPVFLRPRVRVALPHRMALIVGGVPPVRAFGVTPRLISAGLEWAMIDSARWRLALRAHGQTGTITGAFTCPDNVLSSAPGSAGNPTGCNAVSSDVATLRYGAVELQASRRLSPHLVPHASVALTGIEAAFQVNARAFDNVDRTRLQTSGVAWATSVGATVPINARLAFVTDMFIAPLYVRRDPVAAPSVDSFVNLRALISWRFR
jgi:hypothetical protein